MDFNLIFEKSARKHKRKAIMVFVNTGLTLSYTDIRDESLRLASWFLDHGVSKGDSICIWMGNVPEFVIIMAACLRIGAVLVPLNIYESMENVREMCNACACRYLFIDGDNKYIHRQLQNNGSMKDALHAIDVAQTDAPNGIRLGFIPDDIVCRSIRCEFDAHDDALILFTSGSTGQKKGIRKPLSSQYYDSPFMRYLFVLLRYIYPLRFCSMLPWYHTSGIYWLFFILMGNFYFDIVMERFNPIQTRECLEKYHPNVWLGTATMLYRCCISNPSADTPLPAIIYSTGEALSPHVLHTLEKSPGANLLISTYGTTESGGLTVLCYLFSRAKVFFSLLGLSLKKADLVQNLYTLKDFPNNAHALLLGDISLQSDVVIFSDEKNAAVPDGDIGEIVAHSKAAMSGYIKEQMQDIRLDIDGSVFLRTGDLGYKQGKQLYLVGRKKNLIIRSGENIIPSEIERIAEQYPGVNSALACSIPSTDYGEDICLCLEADPSTLDLNSLKTHLCNTLPKYMIPQHYVFYDEFPLNASGKIDMQRIRKEIVCKVTEN